MATVPQVECEEIPRPAIQFLPWSWQSQASGLQIKALQVAPGLKDLGESVLYGNHMNTDLSSITINITTHTKKLIIKKLLKIMIIIVYNNNDKDNGTS